MSFPGLFEVLASDQSDQRLASRKALVLARTRIDDRIGDFLAASKSPQEFAARFELVASDYDGLIRVAVQETGADQGEFTRIAQALANHYYREAASCKCGKSGCVCSGAGCDCDKGCSCAKCSGSHEARFMKGSPDPGDDAYFGGEHGSAKKAFDAMKEQYGDEKGEEVYYATRNKHKGNGKESADQGPGKGGDLACPKCSGNTRERGEFCPDCGWVRGPRAKDDDKESRTGGKEHWIQDAVKKPGDLHKKLHVPEGEKIPESEIENAEKSGDKNLKEKAQFAENVKGLGKGKKKSKYQPTPFSAKPKKLDQRIAKLEKEARRPKMCPYHSEVVDVSLATGNPQAGYETMASHAWGDHHCQGSWEGGKCKFKGSMVNQSYWDERQQQLDEQRAERAERGQENVLDFQAEEPGDFEQEEPAREDIGGEVIELSPEPERGAEPTERADAVPLAAEASVKTADQGNTGLDGPSPKMDKKRWTPTSVPIDEYDGGKHETGDHKEMDPTEVLPRENEGPPGDHNAIKEIGEKETTRETLPTGTGMDDAGFAGPNQEQAPHTDQWGNDGQVKPVTRDTLEAG